uniref:Ig-like domain-containing protein n=1 Tax=Terrapene triunguis TaxID=2587831 RepID=A0A674JWG1_9SAUR
MVFSRAECLFLALLLSELGQATSLLCVSVSQAVKWGCKEMEVAAIAGESVQLQPVKLPEPWAEMTWEVTLDSAQTYRIVTFNKGEPPDLGSSPHFINRVTFHPENLSLQIDPVKKSDSGLYTLQIDIGGGRVNITKFRVSVFGSLLSERVRQRNLTVLSAHQELGQCNVTLSCSVPGTDRVTYRWSRGTSWIPSDRDHQLPGNQSLLHVVINSESHASYKCSVSNPASEETGFFNYRSPCTWNGNIHFFWELESITGGSSGFWGCLLGSFCTGRRETSSWVIEAAGGLSLHPQRVGGDGALRPGTGLLSLCFAGHPLLAPLSFDPCSSLPPSSTPSCGYSMAGARQPMCIIGWHIL